MSTHRYTRLTALFLGLGAGLLPGLGPAQAARTLWGVDTVPLMEGMREEYAFTAPREKPGERTAQAVLVSTRPVLDAMGFYAESLPENGWRLIRLTQKAGTDTPVPMLITPDGTHIQMFQTDTEILTLTGEQVGSRTYLTVEIWAKDAPPDALASSE